MNYLISLANRLLGDEIPTIPLSVEKPNSFNLHIFDDRESYCGFVTIRYTLWDDIYQTNVHNTNTVDYRFDMKPIIYLWTYQTPLIIDKLLEKFNNSLVDRIDYQITTKITNSML